MSLSDLPTELIDEIILESFRLRGVQRGLRLRLVNKLFAEEVWKLINIHNLLDTFLHDENLHYYVDGELAWRMRPLQLYIEHRALKESSGGRPVLSKIRSLAEQLALESEPYKDAEEKNRMVRSYIASMCAELRSAESIRCCFNTYYWIPLVEGYDTLLLCAAIITGNKPLAERLIEQTQDFSWSNYHVWNMERQRMPNREPFKSPLYYAIQQEYYDLVIKYYEVDDHFDLSLVLLDDFAHSESFQQLYVYINNIQTIPEKDPSKELSYEEYCGFERQGPIFEHNQFLFDYFVPRFKDSPPVSLSRYQFEDQLKIAAINGCLERLKQILEMGFYKDDTGLLSVPLQGACRNNQFEAAIILVDAGANPQDGMLEACFICHEDMVRLLLSRGAIANGEMLDFPARAGARSLVKLLLDHGAIPNQGNTFGSKVPQNRDIPGHKRSRLHDIKLGRTVSKRYQDPFVSAIILEHASMFRLMMEKRGVISEETGKRCLRVAQKQGMESMIELLREFGLNVENVETN